MTRQRLNDRRLSVTTPVTHTLGMTGQNLKVLVTFGFGSEGVREVFCADFKAGSDNQALIMDACILISRLLQHGYSPAQLVASLCDPPSLLGAILRAAAEIDAQRHPEGVR